MTISAIVPSFNAARTLPPCLTSLFGQTRPPDEVIVVNDSSTDETPAIARALGATVITPPRKVHAGGARAAGLRASSGTHVAFVDSDMVLHPDWMEGAEERLKRDAGLGAIGGAVEPPDSRNLAEWSDYLMSFSAYAPFLPSSQRVFLPTGNLLVQRHHLESVTFRESYFDDDTSLSFQMVDQGARLLFDPGLRARHLGWRTSVVTLSQAQARYAAGFLSGKGRLGTTDTLLRLPQPLFVPTFALLKLAQIASRVWRSPRCAGMYLLTSPLTLFMLLRRASSVRHFDRAPSSGTPRSASSVTGAGDEPGSSS